MSRKIQFSVWRELNMNSIGAVVKKRKLSDELVGNVIVNS